MGIEERISTAKYLLETMKSEDHLQNIFTGLLYWLDMEAKVNEPHLWDLKL